MDFQQEELAGPALVIVMCVLEAREVSETTDTHNGLTPSPSLTPLSRRSRTAPRTLGLSGATAPKIKHLTKAAIMGLNPEPTTQPSLPLGGGGKNRSI